MTHRQKRFTWLWLPLAVLFVLASSTGCAFKDQNLDLRFTSRLPQIDSSKPSLTVVPPADINGVKHADDGRPIIAHVKNGYGMTTAEVFPNGSIPKWIAESLAAELRAEGFKSTVSDSNSSDGVVVSFVIDHLWIETDVNFWDMAAKGRLDLSFHLTKSGRQFSSFTIQGRSQESSMIGNANLRREALTEVLTHTLEKAVPRIVEELNRR